MPFLPTTKLAVWGLRALWLVLPLAVGPKLGDALHASDDPYRLVASLGLWGIWVAGLLATFIPLPVTLTIVRTIAPAVIAATVWAMATDGIDGTGLIALTAGIFVTAVAFSPQVGALFVDGSSYGEERRFPLRPPLPVLVGPLPLAWALVVAGVVAGPLLLARERWILGGVVTLVGLLVAAAGARSLFALANRFLVFVPAGFVLHDTTAMVDPILFRRESVHFIGPALTDTSAHDLTHGASGLALEVSFVETTKIAKRSRGEASGDITDVDAVLFSPSQPGLVLDEADRRGLPVR